MTKYRTLSPQELSLFEQEFKEYLAINGIDAATWQKLKTNDTEKAEKIIDIFADVIFNSVLIKVKYIEHTHNDSLKYFRYDDEEATLIGLEGDKVNFSDKNSILKAIGDKSNKIEIFCTTKTYQKCREEEIFAMLKKGCSVSDGKMFELLLRIVKT